MAISELRSATVPSTCTVIVSDATSIQDNTIKWQMARICIASWLIFCG